MAAPPLFGFFVALVTVHVARRCPACWPLSFTSGLTITNMSPTEALPLCDFGGLSMYVNVAPLATSLKVRIVFACAATGTRSPVTGGVARGGSAPGLHLLPAAAVAGARLCGGRGPPGPLPPARPGRDARVLERPAAGPAAHAGAPARRAARRARPVGVSRAGGLARARRAVRPARDLAARPLRAECGAGLPRLDLGHAGGPDVLQAVARAHGGAGRAQRALVPVAARALR